ncbi:MAG: hypothetical protein HY458_01710 [Parcubacteria group bacterium]|nr:hypothetical protein [Parcubacteria group bacterium]
MNNSSVLGLATLLGTIVGAGMFGLPYAIVQSGLLLSLFYFLLLGICVTYLHLFFWEVCLRTPGKHRLIGYADLYLGPWAKALVTFSTIAGTVGALLAFLIIGGDFLEILLSPLVSIPSPWHHILFWLPFSLLIGFGIRLIARVEFITTTALFFVMALIFLIAAPHISFANLPLSPGANPFIAFGVILFSLIGWNAIPEIVELFYKKRDKLRFNNLIVAASAAAIGLYLLFSLSVVGVAGQHTSPEALAGLAPFLGTGVIALGAAFGLVSIGDSFLIIGSYLKNSLVRDWRVPNILSIGIASLAPLFLYLLGFREFISVLSAVGIIVGITEGLVIVALFFRARKKGQLKPEYEVRLPRWVPAGIVLVLVLGGAAALAFSF